MVDGIMTFEEFKDKFYKDYNLTEFTIGKDEGVGYEQFAGSIGNWWNILTEGNQKSETVLESYGSEEIRDRVETAQEMLQLLKSEQFLEKLRSFVTEEMVGEVYENIQGRMSMTDIMEFLDQSEVEKKSILSGSF